MDEGPLPAKLAACLAANLLPLLAATGIDTWITARWGADGGMWPLYLILTGAAACGYALAALAAGWLARCLDARLALGVSAGLGTALVLHNALYFALTPDWLAVARGLQRLSPLQAVVYSDRTFWALHGAALAVLAWRCVRRRGAATPPRAP